MQAIFAYSLRQGLKNIYRNGLFSLASIGTIAACLFLFGIFYSVLMNVNNMIQTAETSVGVTVFFQSGITDERIQEIGTLIDARPEVDHKEFISADQAWETFKQQMFEGKEALANSFGTDNPLEDSASYGIYLKDVSKQAELVDYLKTLEGVREVKSSDTTAQGLTTFNHLVTYVSGAIIVILLAVSIFLISTTVSTGIAVRRDEIAVMKLVGATDFFIRAPFVVEGMIIGLIGAAIPLVILYLAYGNVIAYVTNKFLLLSGILDFLDTKVIFHRLIPISILIGVGIGFLGSVWAVRKHLRV